MLHGQPPALPIGRAHRRAVVRPDLRRRCVTRPGQRMDQRPARGRARRARSRGGGRAALPRRVVDAGIAGCLPTRCRPRLDRAGHRPGLPVRLCQPAAPPQEGPRVCGNRTLGRGHAGRLAGSSGTWSPRAFITGITPCRRRTAISPYTFRGSTGSSARTICPTTAGRRNSASRAERYLRQLAYPFARGRA